jgi:hypothetical protein
MGPLGPYGPLGMLGPLDNHIWDASNWLKSLGDWSTFSKLLKGPLSEDGPLGRNGPVSEN